MKRLVVPTPPIWLYDKFGRCVGQEVIEVEAFTKEELKPFQCSECRKANGAHGEYWITTSMDNGEVNGYWKKCSKL